MHRPAKLGRDVYGRVNSGLACTGDRRQALGNHPNGHTLTRWQREAREGAPAGAGAGPGELDRLRLEVATLREMLSDPKAGDPVRLSNRRKAELGERLRRDYGLPSDGS